LPEQAAAPARRKRLFATSELVRELLFTPGTPQAVVDR
jgi:hypothetical protein